MICNRRSRNQGLEGWDDWGQWGDGKQTGEWNNRDEYHCGKADDKDSAEPPLWDHTQKPDEGCWKTGKNDDQPIQYETPETDTPPNAPTTDENEADKEYRCIYNLKEKFGKTASDVKQACPYNKSHIEKRGLGDCCLGDYILIDSATQATTEEEWGGDVKNCIGGLARMNWNEGEGFNDAGYPVTIVKESGSKGVNEGYTLHPLIQKVKNNYSLPTANFFKGIEDDKETSEFPPFYNPPEDSGISVKGHPFLTWTCFDNSREVKHRIHLLIREWNTQEEFNRFKESNGSRGDPDTGGIDGKEGSECEYFEKKTPIFDDCNDLRDADDPIGKVYPELKYEGG